MDNYTDNDTNVSTPSPKPGAVIVHEDYFSALHKITQPEKLVACSLYFSRRWMPELGPLGTQIVLILRSLGYYNRKTNELRDGVEIDLTALSNLVGVHPATIKREFARNVALNKFVSRESQYRKCPITNKPLRTTNVYRVKMDDPLHPADQEAFEAELYTRDKGGSKAQSALNTNSRTSDPKAHYAPNDVQTVTEAVQSVIETVQSAQEKVQIAPTLKDYSYRLENTVRTENTNSTPPAPTHGGAAFGGVSVSLFSQPVDVNEAAMKQAALEQQKLEQQKREAGRLVRVEEQKKKDADQRLFSRALTAILEENKGDPLTMKVRSEKVAARFEELIAEAAAADKTEKPPAGEGGREGEALDDN